MEENQVSYRAFVGPEDKYDIMSAIQFVRLFQLGLREDSTVLDLGAGSLRLGRLLLPFLLPGKYYAVEPEKHLVEAGLANELGNDILRIKRPKFVHNRLFDFSGLRLPDSGIDYCIAQSLFSHTSLEQMKLAIKNVSEVLGGLFLATYMRGREDYSGDKWVYPACVTFTRETVGKVADEHGLLTREMSWVHPNGQTWIVLGKNRTTLGDINEADIVPSNLYMVANAELKEQIERYRDMLPIKVARRVKRFYMRTK